MGKEGEGEWEKMEKGENGKRGKEGEWEKEEGGRKRDITTRIVFTAHKNPTITVIKTRATAHL